MRWVAWFSVACIGAIAAMMFLLWAFSGFAGLGVSGHGLAALVLGCVLASAMGVGLMALTFHSNRSDRDEFVHHAARRSHLQDEDARQRADQVGMDRP